MIGGDFRMNGIKIPRGHICWESIYDSNHVLKQIVTSDEICKKFYLYDVKDGNLTKVEANSSPVFKNKIL